MSKKNKVFIWVRHSEFKHDFIEYVLICLRKNGNKDIILPFTKPITYFNNLI